jgi:epoxyqueuosine reductase
MREGLERLRAAIEELAPGVETRVYVDTGPVPERAFARFSGLGWMGKNTCIINEQKGSWFFLGVILTSLALEPDLPAPDRCGTCRACLDACPTGALVEPYVMDAAKCISYLTIELECSIPRELRPDVGRNIFGCDICQDVCPWNSRQSSVVSRQSKSFPPIAVTSQTSAVGDQVSGDGSPSSIQNPPDTRHPAPATFTLFAPPLESLAAMTEDEFKKTFARSPIKRAKYRGWLRNLCVAMGNSGDARFLARLKELTAHPDPIVREHAQWVLEQLRQV